MERPEGWGLLSEKDENELHKARLLAVEEKAYKRITKRINTLYRFADPILMKEPENPPSQEDDTSSPAPTPSPVPDVTTPRLDYQRMYQDVTLDFVAFDSSMERLQFLFTANEKDREHYAQERERIKRDIAAVRANIIHLNQKLEQAKETREQRKQFDKLADEITRNPALRTREEQKAAIRKLQEEIAELKAESSTYSDTWVERRDQFSRIMDESMRLRRLIRDEKEEVERREGMDESNEGEAGQTPRPGTPGGGATPRGESGLKHSIEAGDVVGTPRPLSTTGGRTPARESPAPSTQDNGSFLKPGHALGASFGSGAPSREGTAEQRTEQEEQSERGQGGDDVEMGDEPKDDESEPDSPLSPPPADLPQILVDGQGDTMDTT
ncbi:Tho complex subunit 7-domain-containing protein [Apiosordaria backusii]|uniref:Tho complex subunit 7-domain-containing protein n=1 Tax=Apiosordaria backusii TaxID=314023 RepID=A0AA40K6Z3_9PEZI|nr:Tho complex subunit 7-domain-containing protein [Apiosordaria backusii]